MKVRLIMVLVLVGLALLSAIQTKSRKTLALSTDVNTATIPMLRLEDDVYNWDVRHDQIMRIKEKIDPEIVLIGDSITHFWGGQPDAGRVGNRGSESWQELFGKRRVLNLGFGWDRTQNVLKRLELGELDGLKPQAIVLLIGTNNLAQTSNCRANTPEEIAAGIAAIIDRCQQKCPKAKLILMAVFPRGKPLDPKRSHILEINARLATLSQKSRIGFLDLTDRWLQPDGTIHPDLMPGSLHPNQNGHRLWAEALKPLLP